MLNAKQLSNLITTIGKSSAKVREYVQTAAINVTCHAVQHGDTTLATRLVDALGMGGRKQALVSWLEEFGPFSYDVKNEVCKLAPRKLDKMLGEFAGNRETCAAALEQSLASVPTWFEFVREKVKSAYDAEKQIANVISAIASKQAKGEDVKGAGIVPFLVDAVAKYHRANLLQDADLMNELLQQHAFRAVPAEEQVGTPPDSPALKAA